MSELALTHKISYTIYSNTGRPSSVILLRVVASALIFVCGFSKLQNFSFGPKTAFQQPIHCPSVDCIATHERVRFNSATLIITAAGLPRHATTGLNFCNVLILKRRIMRRLRAQGGVLWWWNNDLDCLTKTGLEQVISWCAVVSAIPRNWLTGLSIRSRISGKAVISPTLSQARAAQILSPVVRSRPRCSLQQDLRLAFVLCVFCSHSPSPKIFKPVLSIARQAMSIAEREVQDGPGPVIFAAGFVRRRTPFPRYDRVEKSGTGASSFISFAILRITPWVWRNGSL